MRQSCPVMETRRPAGGQDLQHAGDAAAMECEYPVAQLLYSSLAQSGITSMIGATADGFCAKLLHEVAAYGATVLAVPTADSAIYAGCGHFLMRQGVACICASGPGECTIQQLLQANVASYLIERWP